MDDNEYKSYRLRASICPGLETKWPPAETSHGIALHKAANEMRAHVDKTLAAIEAVDADKSLSPEGKREKKREIGTKALNEMETGTSVVRAREAVELQMRKWADRIAANVKPPADHVEAVLFAQVRAKVADMKENRVGFLKQHADDPVVASSLLTAPPFLSGLSDGELAMVRDVVERKFLSPEIIEAKTQVANALLETERSLRAAQAMIRQHARVEKPTAAELAMARSRQVA